MIENDKDLNTVSFVSEIVAAYVSHNKMEVSDLPNFMKLVYKSLCHVEDKLSSLLSPRGEPAVSIEASVTPDYIICLEDGKRLKMLKRHLKSAFNMTPDQYRERWDLPLDYPMVAFNYAKRRTDIAKSFGLGTLRKKQQKIAA